MTVDRSFLEVLKTAQPDAFSTDAPVVNTVFIDGMSILLDKPLARYVGDTYSQVVNSDGEVGNLLPNNQRQRVSREVVHVLNNPLPPTGQLRMQIPHGIDDWCAFFECLYRRMIQRYLEMPGVQKLVLAFDDHDHSPLAKGPTQAKRRSRSEVPAWNPLQPLPPMIPANYAQLLFNRSFKQRIIRYVVEQVVKQCKIVRPGQQIIIDYQNRPYVAVGEGEAQSAGAIGEGSPPVSALEYNVTCPLGECDLKWVRYTAWGDMILDAVDSDYVIVGTSVIERLGQAAPRIFVRRLVLTLGNAAIGAAGGEVVKKSSKKRPLEVAAPVPVKKAGRKYEYADCNILVGTIRKKFGSATPPKLKSCTVQIFSFCVALCGCDFTHGVSWFNGSTFWKHGSLLWPGICAAAALDAMTGIVSMNPRIIAEKVIGKLWKDIQFKKFCMSTNSFEQLHKELMNNGSISAFRRDRLITPEKLCCLVKACNWTVHYWSSCETCPCAVHGAADYGFLLGTGGRVIFDDIKALPAV